ncbi:phosphotransferase [Sphaerisporangium dianthi]|uniref:Phosphotransferase n=1 Tax=Sphaerisporangium dianthi TaxID=1436120 RepID=A0ABV9CTW1_9ACTN
MRVCSGVPDGVAAQEDEEAGGLAPAHHGRRGAGPPAHCRAVPRWADIPSEPVANGGRDDWTLHLGDEMSVRLPSASEYALAVEKEHRWLPPLAARLPLPIPAPLAKGEPGAGHPFSWSVHQWLDGEPASADRIADAVGFAVDLPGFVAALQSIDTVDGPRPGKHNWFGGATLRTYEGQFESFRRSSGHGS